MANTAAITQHMTKSVTTTQNLTSTILGISAICTKNQLDKQHAVKTTEIYSMAYVRQYITYTHIVLIATIFIILNTFVETKAQHNTGKTGFRRKKVYAIL